MLFIDQSGSQGRVMRANRVSSRDLINCIWAKDWDRLPFKRCNFSFHMILNPSNSGTIKEWRHDISVCTYIYTDANTTVQTQTSIPVAIFKQRGVTQQSSVPIVTNKILRGSWLEFNGLHQFTRNNKCEWTDHSSKNISLPLIKSNLTSVVLKQQRILP